MPLQNLSRYFSPSFIAESQLNKTLGQEFVLCENGNMVFHWADFHETCDLISAQIDSDEELLEDFKGRENALKRLALIPVWIRTEYKIQQSTMFDLYEKYILNQIQPLTGIDPFCPLDISFISGTGPFKSMSIAECFNRGTYRDFIMVYLLKGKLPKRDFRIRLKSKILLEYGKSFRNAELVSLEQLTVNGLLISMDSEAYLQKVSNQEYVRLLVNTRILAEGKNKDLDSLKGFLSQFAFNLLYSSHKEDNLTVGLKEMSIQSSFDYSFNKRVFLFISYEKLSQMHPASVKTIQDFVNHTKGLVKDHYHNLNHKESA